MNTVDLIFEYKGPVAVTQRCRVHGELTHKARDVTVRSTRPYGEYEIGLLFSYVESVFRARVEYSIVPDGMRYCEVFARDGTRLFDSRDLIPCEPPPARKLAVTREPDDGYGGGRTRAAFETSESSSTDLVGCYSGWTKQEASVARLRAHKVLSARRML